MSGHTKGFGWEIKKIAVWILSKWEYSNCYLFYFSTKIKPCLLPWWTRWDCFLGLGLYGSDSEDSDEDNRGAVGSSSSSDSDSDDYEERFHRKREAFNRMQRQRLEDQEREEEEKLKKKKRKRGNIFFNNFFNLNWFLFWYH